MLVGASPVRCPIRIGTLLTAHIFTLPNGDPIRRKQAKLHQAALRGRSEPFMFSRMTGQERWGRGKDETRRRDYDVDCL